MKTIVKNNLFNLKNILLLESDRTELLYEIAKLIDGDYVGASDTFTVKNNSDLIYITTDKCDDASMIKIYRNGNIKRLGPDTTGWVCLQPETIRRINKCCQVYLTTKVCNWYKIGNIDYSPEAQNQADYYQI